MTPRLEGLEAVAPERLLPLIRQALGPGPPMPSVDLWRWKHVDNPFGPSLGAVALAGDQPVALRPLMRWRWRLGHQVVRSLRAVDTATHPAWRHRGLFKRLTKSVLAELRDGEAAFLFNTPNAKSRPGYLKMGWVVAGRVPLLVKPLGLAGLVRGSAATLLGRSRSGTTTDLSRASDVLSHADLDALVPRREDATHYSTDRSAEYLRWRYARSPAVDYRALSTIRAADSALVVTRARSRRGFREFGLSEVLWTRGAESLAREAVQGALQRSRADYAIAAACSGSAEDRLLRGLGFLPVPFGPLLTVKRLSAGLAVDCARIENWRPSLGDVEVF